MKTQSLSDEWASMRELMDNTRFAAVENGRYLLVWGIALSLGVAYSEVQNAWGMTASPWIVWVALLSGAWAYALLAKGREQREARRRWLIVVGALWCAAVVLFAIPREAIGIVLLACLLALFVLPGAVLNARSRKLPSRML